MTKIEFLTALAARLSGIPADDRQKSLEYYAEMIDDRIDDGLSEEEAVNAVGSMDAIVEEILSGTSAKSTGTTAQKMFEKTVYTVNDAFRNIRVDAQCADIIFDLSENGQNCVVCTQSGNQDFTVTVENGTLLVKQKDRLKWYQQILFRSTSTDATLYLTKTQFDSLHMSLVSGDVEIPAPFRFTNVSILTTSGDVDFDAAVEEALSVEAISGDITIDGVEAKTITCKTVSGDIDLEDCDAGIVKLSATSGDIDASLLTGKQFSVSSVTGDTEVPAGTDGGLCEASTVSGDVTIKVLR